MEKQTKKIEEHGKIDKYEYLTCEKVLPSDQSRNIEQTNLTYSPLGKVFKNDQRTKRKANKSNQK